MVLWRREVENVVGGGGCSVGEGCSGWRRV